jgi:hypothetical protein
MAIQDVHNDRQLVRAFAAIETTPGTAAVADFVLLGDMVINETRPLSDVASFAGTYAQDYAVVYGPKDIGGTYSEPLTYEGLANTARLALAAGPTGVSDAQTTPSYLYTYNHNMTASTRQSASIYYGFPELLFLCTGARFSAFNVSCDIDDANASWMLNVPTIYASSKDIYLRQEGTATTATSTVITDTAMSIGTTQYVGGYIHIIGGTGKDQVRQIVSHTATAVTTAAWTVTPAIGSTFMLVGPTPALSVPSYRTIAAADTQVFIDDYTGGTIGTTDESDRVISWNVGFEWPIQPKRFQGSGDGYDAKTGAGAIRVAGSIRMEFDSPKEYERFIGKEEVRLRFKQTDTQLINTSPATYRTAQIDVFKAALEAPAFDYRNSNMTQTINFRGYVDSVEGIIERVIVRTATSALP